MKSLFVRIAIPLKQFGFAKAELTGKVGNVEPDPSEQFPLSWSQKRDLFMQLITMQNPVIGR